MSGRRNGTGEAKQAKPVQPNVPPAALARLCPQTSLHDLNRRTGVSMSMLSKLFNGKRTPSVRVAKLLAMELGTTVDRLLLVFEQAKQERREKLEKQKQVESVA